MLISIPSSLLIPIPNSVTTSPNEADPTKFDVLFDYGDAFGDLGITTYKKRLHFVDDDNSCADVQMSNWCLAMVRITGQFQVVWKMHPHLNYSPPQEKAWLNWLQQTCDPAVAAFGKGQIPHDVRWFINTVERHLDGRAVTDFGVDSNAQGVWIPPFYSTDFEDIPVTSDPVWHALDHTTFYNACSPPGKYKVDLAPAVGGGWRGFFLFSETYGKEIYLPIADGQRAGEEAAVFMTQVWDVNKKFQQISAMEANRNFTDEQQREWRRWLLQKCDPLVERWGKGNIPATLRAWINAVERNLQGRAMTAFGDDNNSHNNNSSGCLGPMFDNMSSFGPY